MPGGYDFKGVHGGSPPYLGNGGGRQDGSRKMAGRGGDSDFSCREKHFLLQEGKGAAKLRKSLKNALYERNCSKYV